VKKFATPKILSKEDLADAVSNLSTGEYVYYTGGVYSARKNSGRFRSFSTIRKNEAGKPIPLAEYVRRAAAAVDPETGKGFGTDISVGGLRLHQQAKSGDGVVYLFLEKDPEGNFRAVTRIASPDRRTFADAYAKGGFEAGDIVIPAKAKKPSKSVAVKK
jgi:hypothetical protein